MMQMREYDEAKLQLLTQKILGRQRAEELWQHCNGDAKLVATHLRLIVDPADDLTRMVHFQS